MTLPSTRFIEDVNNRRRNFISLNLDTVPRNSAPGGGAYIKVSAWVGIIARKAKRTQIHFSNNVFAAITSLDLKVPKEICLTN